MDPVHSFPLKWGQTKALEYFEDVYMFVISLLQKYRLHNRRPSAAVHSSSSNTTNPPIPQFLVVSGIWVPPPDYTVAAPLADAPCTPAVGVFAPAASLPSDSRVRPQQSKQSDRSPTGPQLEKGGRSEESNSSGNAAAFNSLSPAASSSSQTTTASHRLHRSWPRMHFLLTWAFATSLDRPPWNKQTEVHEAHDMFVR